MKHNANIIEQQAPQWVKQGWDDPRVKEELLQRGIDERYIPDMMVQVRKLRNAHKTASGLYFVLAGAVCCLFSCILTLAVPGSNTGFVLYGLTSIGILVAFLGLYKILG